LNRLLLPVARPRVLRVVVSAASDLALRRPDPRAAEPGQVVVASTFKDAVAGAGIAFQELGMRAPKGVSDL
jgi:hypothetical protein